MRDKVVFVRKWYIEYSIFLLLSKPPELSGHFFPGSTSLIYFGFYSLYPGFLQQYALFILTQNEVSVRSGAARKGDTQYSCSSLLLLSV